MARGALRVLLVLLMMAPAVASADAIDEYLRVEMNARKIPGLALAVVRHGAVVTRTLPNGRRSS